MMIECQSVVLSINYAVFLRNNPKTIGIKKIAMEINSKPDP